MLCLDGYSSTIHALQKTNSSMVYTDNGIIAIDLSTEAANDETENSRAKKKAVRILKKYIDRDFILFIPFKISWAVSD